MCAGSKRLWYCHSSANPTDGSNRAMRSSCLTKRGLGQIAVALVAKRNEIKMPSIACKASGCLGMLGVWTKHEPQEHSHRKIKVCRTLEWLSQVLANQMSRTPTSSSKEQFETFALTGIVCTSCRH